MECHRLRIRLLSLSVFGPASQEQRSTLLWVGLQEPRPDVRKAAQGLLVKWFTEDAAGDVVALLAAFGPQENASKWSRLASTYVVKGRQRRMQCTQTTCSPP